MIDEDLYKIATDELNSGERKPEVWARACALASDDHDEARFLYTNLRVEEMLNKDGRKRTFSTSEQHRNANFNNAMQSDALELEPTESFGNGSMDSSEPDMDSTIAQTDSSPMEIESVGTPLLPDDEPDSIEMGDLNAPISAAGTDALSDKVVEFDDETMAEIAALSNESSNDTNAVSSIAGKSENANQVNESAVDSSDVVAGVFAASAGANREQILSQDQAKASAAITAATDDIKYPSQTKSVDVVPHIAGDALANQEDLDATVNTSYADSANAANDDAASENQGTSNLTKQSNLSDTHQITDETSSMDATAALDTGVGRSFMVFNRHGTFKSIKQGVSWPALLFTFPWLLSKALFGTALVYGCLWLVSLGGLLITSNRWFIAGSDATIDIKLWTGAFAVLAIVGLLYIPFRYGNRWVAEKLQKRGFRYEGSVSAVNKLDAADRLIQFNQENTL